MIEAYGTPTGKDCQRPTCTASVFVLDGDRTCTADHGQLERPVVSP